MKINTIPTLALSLLLLSACSTKNDIKPSTSDVNTTLGIQSVTKQITPNITQTVTPNIIQTITSNSIAPNSVTSNLITMNEETEGLAGHFSGNYKLLEFIDRMHFEHNFDKSYLYKLFSDAQDLAQIEEPCTTRDTRSRCNTIIKPQGKWDRYQGMFIYERNIKRGVAFWEEHENTLNQAYHTYGVLPQYIIGILGVETAYGVNFGKKRVIDVLTSKSMLNNRREGFYTKQLEKFLIMTRNSNLDASVLMGSNAGAMGYGQFIASSYLDFAVDFNGDGVIDLWNAEDAIGSIANYFAKNGWKRNIREIATRAKYKGSRFTRLKTGYKTKYSQYKLRKKYGIVARKRLHYKGPVTLVKLPKYSYDELWFGTHNFRVITTYNHSDWYAMTVHKLGETVKNRRYGR